MKVIRLEETESTNSFAKSNIDDLEDRTVIHSLRQSCGRGRLNRSWVDFGDGNLFMSIVLKPSNAYKSVYSNLTQYTSVILCEVLEEYGLSPKIKWPNDVLIDGERKISGILCETVMEGLNLKGIVVGIGVNLNVSKDSVSRVTDRIVTGLNLEIGKIVYVCDFCDEVIEKFFANYDEFLDKGFEFIKNDYVRLNCSLNKDLSVQILNDIKSGYAKGVNDNGELLLHTNDNKELVLSIGDIL